MDPNGTVIFAMMAFARNAQIAYAAAHIGRDRYPITRLIAQDPTSRLFDNARKFVANYQRILLADTFRAVLQHTQVSTANGGDFATQKNLVVFDFGYGNFFNTQILFSVKSRS
jgi:hypothetical protein